MSKIFMLFLCCLIALSSNGQQIADSVAVQEIIASGNITKSDTPQPDTLRTDTLRYDVGSRDAIVADSASFEKGIAPLKKLTASTAKNQPNATAGANATIMYANLRIGKYYVNSNNSLCDFSEQPDPRFRVKWNNGSVVLISDDDVFCSWRNLTYEREHLETSFTINWGASVVRNLNVFAWEDDNCGGNSTFDTDCVFDDDDDPASTNINITFPYNHASGSHELVLNLSGDADYRVALEYEVFPSAAAVLYSLDNAMGRSQIFGEGQYLVNAIRNGVGDDAIRSIYVQPGYKLLAYRDGECTGYPMTYKGGYNTLGEMNDRISSFKIVPDDGLPGNDRTLMIYYPGTGSEVDRDFEKGFSTLVNADDIIVMKGVGGSSKNYTSFNNYNIRYLENEDIYLWPPNISKSNVFKNDNFGGGTHRHIFGIDMDYEGNAIEGYDDGDSREAARNILRVLKRYNLKGYTRVLIAGHSRGSAVGVSSLLFGIKKAIEGNSEFSEFTSTVNQLINQANAINVVSLDPVSGAIIPNDYHMGDNWDIEDIYTWLNNNRPNKFKFSEIYANGARFNDFVSDWGAIFSGYDMVFEPSPYFLYNNPDNNVQRYWLGFRHSSMGNLTEKLGNLYVNGNTKPIFQKADYFNAALSNQTLFRTQSYWLDKFKINDQLAYWEALRIDGCIIERLDEPDSDLQIEYYHGIRHGSFPNDGGQSVNMNNFVGNNNLQLYCTGGFKPVKEPGLYTATREKTDNTGTTHYCNCTGGLVLSLKKGSSGVVVAPSQVSVNIPTGWPAEYIPNGTGFITNPNGAVAMRRTWNVSPSTQPTNGSVPVTFYFTNTDYLAVNSSLLGVGQTELNAPSQMWFYKSSAAPHTTVANTPTALILRNAVSPSLTNWQFANTLSGDYAATLNVTSFSGGGGGGSNGGSSALPVKLLNFSVANNDKTHHLVWTTASEQNSKQFEVEYSTDGITFKTIGTVAAAGNSNIELNYSFDNPVFQPTTNYYRLNMIDYDGSSEHSNVVSIKANNPNTGITAYPNPNTTGIFTLNNAYPLHTTALLNDVLGRSINIPIQNGQIDLSAYPKGVYYIKVKDTTQTKTSILKLVYN